MATLGELAKLIRSKNAGPFVLTIDIMFADAETYERVKRSGRVTQASIAKLFGRSEEAVMFFHVDNCLAIKASMPRPIIQGDIADPDSHAGQQFAPLVDVVIDALPR